MNIAAVGAMKSPTGAEGSSEDHASSSFPYRSVLKYTEPTGLRVWVPSLRCIVVSPHVENGKLSKGRLELLENWPSWWDQHCN